MLVASARRTDKSTVATAAAAAGIGEALAAAALNERRPQRTLSLQQRAARTASRMPHSARLDQRTDETSSADQPKCRGLMNASEYTDFLHGTLAHALQRRYLVTFLRFESRII